MATTPDPVVGVALRTWIVRLRTDRVAIFRVSASKASNAAVVEVAGLVAMIASAVAVDLAVTASAVAAGLAVIALVEAADLADSAEVALAGSVGAAGGAGSN